MEQQQEWMRLLTYSSKLQIQPLASSVKEYENAEDMVKQSSDVSVKDKKQISSCQQGDRLTSIQRSADSVNFMNQHEESSSQLSKIKELDEEDDQKSQIQPFRYNFLQENSTQTQNQDQRFIQKLTNTIRGLTDQVLAYRKKIDELTTRQNESQQQEADVIMQASIYTKKGSILEGRNLASQAIQIEALKKKLIRKQQEIQTIKKENLMLIELKQGQSIEIKELRIKIQKNSDGAQAQLLKIQQTIKQLYEKLKDKDIRYGDLHKKFSESMMKFYPGRQCLSTSDQEPSFAQITTKRPQAFNHEMEDLKGMVNELKASLQVKDESINYTQKMLIKAQTERINADIHRQLLEEELEDIKSINNVEKAAQLQNEIQIYLTKIERLQSKILILEEALQEKRKERKMVPETMSPQETVSFLVRTLRKVTKSANLLKMLSLNSQFQAILLNILQKLEIND